MTDNKNPSPDLLAQATHYVKSGRLADAKDLLAKYLMTNPASDQAWLLMSYVVADPAQQKDCLERVLRLNPENSVAKSKLALLTGAASSLKPDKHMETGPAVPTAPSNAVPTESPEPSFLKPKLKGTSPLTLRPKITDSIAASASTGASSSSAPVAAAPIPNVNLEPLPVEKPGPSQPIAPIVREPQTSQEKTEAPSLSPSDKKSNRGDWIFRITVAVLIITIVGILAIGISPFVVTSFQPTPTEVPTVTPAILALPSPWTATATPKPSATETIKPTDTITKTPTPHPTETTTPTLK